MASFSFIGVGKRYPDGTHAVTDLDLEVRDGEFMVLVGPSGCGKTTALRMAAGLEEISGGELRIGDRLVNQLSPSQRDIAMVFQNYALYPHMTVEQNIAFPLECQKLPRPEIRARTERAATILGLTEHLKRRPKALSGGQRQRVAMGRAIVRQPQVFLMDEPLSNLDAKLRGQMRAEIREIQRDFGATTIYVTHDQVEAMTMGDRIAVLRKGRLQQLGTPEELYERPANLFVAEFIGSPPMNVLPAVLRHEGAEVIALAGPQRITLGADFLARLPGGAAYLDRPVVLGVRPEDLHDAALADPSWPRLKATVALVEVLPPERMVHLSVDVEPARTAEMAEIAQDVDDAAMAELTATKTTLIGRFPGASGARAGTEHEIALAPGRLHLFDAETGEAIR